MSQKYLRKHRIAALLISTLIFVFSLTQETFYINREGHEDVWASGFANLALGAFCKNPSWLANLAIIPAWISTEKKSVYPIVLSALAFVLAFSFFFNGKITGNEAGHSEYATEYLMGYWLWVLSILLYHLLILVLEKRRQ